MCGLDLLLLPGTAAAGVEVLPFDQRDGGTATAWDVIRLDIVPIGSAGIDPPITVGVDAFFRPVRARIDAHADGPGSFRDCVRRLVGLGARYCILALLNRGFGSLQRKRST